MSETLEGKVALVTGAASGIGRASAIALAHAGAQVVVADVLVEGAEATVQATVAAGGQGLFIRTDVTRAKDIEAAVA